MDLPNFYCKSETFYIYYIFIDMGRKSKTLEDRKIKFGISLDRKIFNHMVNDKIMKSRLIEKLLKQYYENQDML